MKADLSFLQAIILALFRNQIRPSDAQPVNFMIIGLTIENPADNK
jgi:hypothetical protein